MTCRWRANQLSSRTPEKAWYASPDHLQHLSAHIERPNTRYILNLFRHGASSSFLASRPPGVAGIARSRRLATTPTALGDEYHKNEQESCEAEDSRDGFPFAGAGGVRGRRCDDLDGEFGRVIVRK